MLQKQASLKRVKTPMHTLHYCWIFPSVIKILFFYCRQNSIFLLTPQEYYQTNDIDYQNNEEKQKYKPRRILTIKKRERKNN